MHSGFNGYFGGMLGAESDEEEPITAPLPGTANLKVEDRCQALFITAEWVIVARVGETELARSTHRSIPHSKAYVAQWTRQFIRQNKERLRRLGVDVPRTYVQQGGLLSDLDD